MTPTLREMRKQKNNCSAQDTVEQREQRWEQTDKGLVKEDHRKQMNKGSTLGASEEKYELTNVSFNYY